MRNQQKIRFIIHEWDKDKPINCSICGKEDLENSNQGWSGIATVGFFMHEFHTFYCSRECMMKIMLKTVEKEIERTYDELFKIRRSPKGKTEAIERKALLLNQCSTIKQLLIADSEEVKIREENNQKRTQKMLKTRKERHGY